MKKGRLKTVYPAFIDTTGLLFLDSLKYHGCLTYWRTIIPYTNIKAAGGSEVPAVEQKAELIAGITKLLARVLGKNPETTVVVIDEVDTENWEIGGGSVVVRRRK